MSLALKLLKLKQILCRMKSALVAFSGGTDSTFLLKIALDTLGANVLAVTAVSASYPKEELIFAEKTARLFKAKHKIIRTREFKDKNFLSNPVNRCYFCKKELFSQLKGIARKNKMNFVLDASNLSDKKDFRPGNKAKREFRIRSPLQEAGLTKSDVRILSKKLKLATWDKPTLACLASRVAYGIKITRNLLDRINKAENYLKSLGISCVRVRDYGRLCRIECDLRKADLILSRNKQIAGRFKSLGYQYITLDILGFRSGSMNEVLRK
ncbi:MAG: ATP-dependent sacrificial sulfur transferase LarE [Candidatus Omnitrophica bacterium]|jgi:uncharacterized protein|nr:ATP-dependent sacrificial sulfur transferase LarE [Candidatus Omnitrophota bacterium]